MFTFRLDSKSGVPIYRQIVDQVRHGIASGRLHPREQLPTVRTLAVELAVNPNTVVKAYSLLKKQEILVGVRGFGTFVVRAPKASPSPDEREAKLFSLCAQFLGRVAYHDFAAEDVLRAIQKLNTRRPS
jgi:DNA-binding transcriptional regulator YhcF (GntR family)